MRDQHGLIQPANDLGPRFADPKDCPRKHLHTKAPQSYLGWHEWAEKKSRRHYQIRCPGCGLLTIWRRKPRA